MTNRIKKLRHEKKITLQQLSKVTGISVSSLSAYENNRRSPKIENWIKIADFFNVPVAYLQGNAFSPYQIGVNDIFDQFAYDYGLANGDSDVDIDNISDDKKERISEAIFGFKEAISFLLSSDEHSKDSVYNDYLNSLLGIVFLLSYSYIGDKEMKTSTRKKILRKYIDLINDFFEKVDESDIGHLVLEHRGDNNEPGNGSNNN